MKLTIDKEADALYLNLEDAPAAETEEVAPGILVDYNADKKIVGIEMLYLSKRVSHLDTAKLIFETVAAKT